MLAKCIKQKMKIYLLFHNVKTPNNGTKREKTEWTASLHEPNTINETMTRNPKEKIKITTPYGDFSNVCVPAL